MQAFEQGFRAHVAGTPEDRNPYEDQHSDDWRRWRRGWKTAQLVDASRMSLEEIEYGLKEVMPDPD